MTRRLRVLVIAAWPPWPLTDGARLLLHHQLRVLGRSHDITLVAPVRNPGEEEAPPDAAVDGIRIILAGRPASRPWRYARSRLAGWATREPAEVHRVVTPALRRALTNAMEPPPDLVHLFGWGTAALAREFRPLPVVHTAIDAWALGHRMRHVPVWRRVLESDQGALVRRHERRHYPSCDVVIVVTELDASHLRQTHPGVRVGVVANGVDPGPEPSDRGDGLTLGLHGVFSSRPNVDAARALANDILPLVQHGVPGAHALLVGADPDPSVLALRRDGVEVTGRVDDIRRHLERMTVYVAPLRIGSGIKNKVLEAMAAGRPVVGTGLAVEGIGEGPGLSIAEDAEGLAEHIRRLLGDSSERRAAGRAARTRVVAEFSWERSAARVEELWKAVLR